MAPTALHTMRMPLSELCAFDCDIEHVRAISLAVPEPQDGSSFLHVDSLEVTDHGADVAGLVGGTSAHWGCRATLELVSQQITCGAEPQGGVCPAGRTVTTANQLPSAGNFDGWVVHTPKGWIVDPSAPTPAELASLEIRCQTACEREYAGSPHIQTDCSAAGGFVTPYLLQIPGQSTRRAIPESRRDGSGVFFSESLTCDLFDDCCTNFEEDVCPAAPMRVTPGSDPLHRGEDWVVSVEGTLTIIELDDGTEDIGTMSGTIGYSQCASGNGAAPCPFYLGSMDLQLDAPMVAALDCGGMSSTIPLTTLEVDLAQPAFGIASQGVDDVGFVSGSLVFDVHAESGPLPFDFSRLNQQDLVFGATAGDVDVSSGSGLSIFTSVLCNGGVEQIEGRIELTTNAVVDHPPTVTITTPAVVPCSSTVSLAATVGDLDGDAGPVRWEIDGVAMDLAMTSVFITTNHELRAIVHDARGAVGTDTLSLICTP